MPASRGEFYWGGAYSTAFFVDPVEKLTMVFMTADLSLVGLSDPPPAQDPDLFRARDELRVKGTSSVSIVTTEKHDEVLVIVANNPPVNALGAAVRQGLVAGIEQTLGDASVKAVVIRCNGRTFFAGADITEFGKPPVGHYLVEALDKLDRNGVGTRPTAYGGKVPDSRQSANGRIADIRAVTSNRPLLALVPAAQQVWRSA